MSNFPPPQYLPQGGDWLCNYFGWQCRRTFGAQDNCYSVPGSRCCADCPVRRGLCLLEECQWDSHNLRHQLTTSHNALAQIQNFVGNLLQQGVQGQPGPAGPLAWLLAPAGVGMAPAGIAGIAAPAGIGQPCKPPQPKPPPQVQAMVHVGFASPLPQTVVNAPPAQDVAEPVVKAGIVGEWLQQEFAYRASFLSRNRRQRLKPWFTLDPTHHPHRQWSTLHQLKM